MLKTLRYFGLIGATLLIAAPAAAVDVNLIGLAEGTAVLVIDSGKPRMLRVGQTGPGGVKLLAANPNYAEIVVNGERRRLTLGAGAYATPPEVERASVTLTSDSNGHFLTAGTINGAAVRFLVDTGASLIAMGAADARRAGINYLAGKKVYASTANGVTPVYRVKLDRVRVGDIVLNNVDAMVNASSDLPVVLLGMSFLDQLDMQRQGELLTLKRRY